MRVALFALLLALSPPALAGPRPLHDAEAPQSRAPIEAAIQLAQTCVCHNPAASAGETLCRRQRIVRCRANTRNQCAWEETNDRC
jgi:hypothetical protein